MSSRADRLRHVRGLRVCGLNSLGVHAAVAFREKLFKRVSLFVLKCLPSRFFQVSYLRFLCEFVPLGGLACPKQMGAATINVM